MTNKEASIIMKSYMENPNVYEKLAFDMAIKKLEQESVIDKIRTEIKKKIEEEEFARSVFRHEEKDTVKAEQCTGSIMAYNNVIKLIDKYKTGGEE